MENCPLYVRVFDRDVPCRWWMGHIGPCNPDNNSNPKQGMIDLLQDDLSELIEHDSESGHLTKAGLKDRLRQTIEGLEGF